MIKRKNSKFELRNTKQIQITQNRNTKPLLYLEFRYSYLVFTQKGGDLNAAG